LELVEIPLPMNDFQLPENNQQAGPARPAAGVDLLPPVEPPSAGFIIQLFVVPALIVVVIVFVWLAFSWIVRTASRPEEVIQGLEAGPRVARWQRASELADMLRNKRFADFRRSAKAAAHLSGILDREIDQAGAAGGMAEGEVALRAFLARALGEFDVNEGIDVLLKAAETSRDPAEQLVRQRALEAIAVRAFNLQELDPPQALSHPGLEPTLSRLAGDEDPLIRRRVAFALGQIGTPACIERLEVMVDDPDADTRYNAAVALAHRGNDRAGETLAEMLDLEESAGLKEETDEQSRAMKRAVMVSNALKAVEELGRKNPDADLSVVIEALEQLAEANSETLTNAQLPPRAVSDAAHVLKVLNASQAEATP
jgi:HEAT repeat protein